jgi:hypothetical protein
MRHLFSDGLNLSKHLLEVTAMTQPMPQPAAASPRI